MEKSGGGRGHRVRRRERGKRGEEKGREEGEGRERVFARLPQPPSPGGLFLWLVLLII